MKNTITLLGLLFAVNALATDRFVDPNLSQGNGTTLFTTITDAVAAAVNGDRIIVASSTYNEAELTIDKSLQIIPQIAGTTINCNFNIVVSGFPGMNLEIIGFNLGIYNISSTTVLNGSNSNRAIISLIDINLKSIQFSHDFYKLNCLKCNVTNNVEFRYGVFISSMSTNLSITDEQNSNLSDTKILIADNTISGRLSYRNDDHKFIITNNSLNEIYVWKWNYLSNITNFVLNNDFAANCKIFVPSTPPNYNLDFSNNFFQGTTYFVSPNGCNGGYDGTENAYCPGTFNLILSTSSSSFPHVNVSGFFSWTYNGIDLPCNTPDSSSPLTLTKIVGQTNPIDGGNPNHKYYDIDLTINDRGINGGPYSQLNYNASNPNNSRAFIFDIEMPVDLFPGQDVEIKAKGYHSN